jgi:coenzyme PQQ synthesis protein D (PqqD)
MKRNDRAPNARRSQLMIKELAHETLVYDESNHQAHCLNQTAAFVWKHCDGRRSIPTLARMMEKEMNAGVSEQTVRFAIKQLEQARLLEASPSGSAWLPQTSRRELMRTLGVAAVALPIVISVVAPQAAMAATCGTAGQGCTGPGQGTCCAGFTCCGITCFAGVGCP